MPKMKTRSGAKKRVKVLKSGKIKCSHAKRRHLLSHMSAGSKRALRKGTHVHPADAKPMMALLPYG